MQIISRIAQKQIEDELFKGKAIIIYGARQVGKTTLAKQIIEKYGEEASYFDCELLSVRQNLEIPEASRLKSYLGRYKLVVLDEMQKMSNAGTILKILVDHCPEIQIIATGSSSFEMANKTSEPMTGRAKRFTLYPFSIIELEQEYNRFEIDGKLENIMRFGTYPEVFLAENEDSIKEKVDEIVSNYLYKDILAFEGINKSSVIENLLKLLALQLGREVSYTELAKNLGISRLTVQKYIDILEQSFIVFTLKAFSRNMRKEISKSVKIYFYDLGIRNSLIQNFNLLSLRNDTGALWENLLIAERIKRNSHQKLRPNKYFWRTYDQQEIDFIEEQNGKLFGYEMKWKKKQVKAPAEWLKNYENSSFEIINKENYFEFVGRKD
ncbi:MAG TPA: ATP-binding protein [Candidatus Moranbacteria bacterium]|nr:ATP-binding protein [Candidatus Moranbacteria bacterium]